MHFNLPEHEIKTALREVWTTSLPTIDESTKRSTLNMTYDEQKTSTRPSAINDSDIEEDIYENSYSIR